MSTASRARRAVAAAATVVLCAATAGVAASAPPTGQPPEAASPPAVELLQDSLADRVSWVSRGATTRQGTVLTPRPPRPAPVKSIRSLQYSPDLGSVQAAIDRCAGPAAWNGAGYGVPWLVIEHDFCGGTWVLGLERGELLRIANGPLAGTWRANGRTLVVALGSPITVVRGLGPLAAQTCIPGTNRTKFVGFDRVRRARS